MPSLRGSSPFVDESILSSSHEIAAIVSSYLRNYDDVGEKVDYSEFKNFTWFGSAHNKFSIFLYKIFNDYKRCFTWGEWYQWWDSLSGYEKYLWKEYPSYYGYFTNSNSDSGIFGIDYENKMCLTSSDHALSIEFIAHLTASTENQYILKVGKNEHYYEVFLSSSNALIFRIQSGSTVNSASYAMSASNFQYGSHYAFCYSSASGITDVYVDANLAMQTSSYGINDLIIESGTPVFVACSSSDDLNPDVCFITGAIDEVRIWNSHRSSVQISTYKDRRIRWEPELKTYIKFNEPGYITSDGSTYRQILDHAIHPITYDVVNYSSNKVSGSIVGQYGSLMIDAYDYFDPILFEDHTDVVQYVNIQWSTASEYDNHNRYLITNLVPNSYIEEEEELGTYNLSNILYVIGAQLDAIKLHIQHMGHFHNYHIGNDSAPHKLLRDAIEMYGFQSFDNFPNSSISDYLIAHSASGDILYSIKEINDIFWRNLLTNIPLIYKTKGTSKSVYSTLHCLGIDDEILAVKNYEPNDVYKVGNTYINKNKYSKVLDFGGRRDWEKIRHFYGVAPFFNINTCSFVFVSSSQLPHAVNDFSIETLISFKPYEYYESGTFFVKTITSEPYMETGSIWGINNNIPPSTASEELCLMFNRNLTSSYGDVLVVMSESTVGISTILKAEYVPVFDGNYYNICYKQINNATHSLDIRKLENIDQIEYIYSGSDYATISTNFGQYMCIGAFSGSTIPNASFTEVCQTEFRLWNLLLSSSDIDGHTLNYTSVGIKNPESDYLNLIGHWSFDNNLISDNSGVIYDIPNYSYYRELMSGTGYNFAENTSGNFFYHLFDYNFICPDLSLKWNNHGNVFYENETYERDNAINITTIEYNMVDALNEDMIRLYSDVKRFNNLIGIPVMKYRTTYDLHNTSIYFSRLAKNISFVNYFDNLSNIDQFYTTIIEQLIPARNNFYGDEKVIESAILERNKNTMPKTRGTTTTTTLISSISRPPLRPGPT